MSSLVGVCWHGNRSIGGACMSKKCHSNPQTWQLPPEPGPEVTAVRDVNGDRWVVGYDYNRQRVLWEREGDGNRMDWACLLGTMETLTDASAELEE